MIDRAEKIVTCQFTCPGNRNHTQLPADRQLIAWQQFAFWENQLSGLPGRKMGAQLSNKVSVSDDSCLNLARALVGARDSALG